MRTVGTGMTNLDVYWHEDIARGCKRHYKVENARSSSMQLPIG